MEKISTIEEKLDAIAKEVCQVCCFGGSNKSQPKQISTLINELVQIIAKSRGHSLISDEALQQSGMPEEVRNVFKSLTQSLGNDFEKNYGIKLEDWGKYFVHKNEMEAYLNPAFLLKTIPKLNDWIKPCIGTEYEHQEPVSNIIDILKKFTDVELKDLQKVIAFMTYMWSTRVKSNQAFFKGRLKDIEIGQKYSVHDATEPTDPKHRKLLIEYMVNDLVRGSFVYGIGNCQPMAELSFLLAVQQISGKEIRYVRFQHSDKKYEELNAIIVGNYPNPGSIILAPWYSAKHFPWQGSLSDTPQIKHYDEIKVIYTVKDTKEQKKIQNILNNMKFDVSKLLKNPNRVPMLNYIVATSQKVFDHFKLFSANNAVSEGVKSPFDD